MLVPVDMEKRSMHRPLNTVAALLVALILILTASPVGAQGATKTFKEITENPSVQKFPGFIPLYWDSRDGKLHLEISRFDEELLYVVSLPAGLGSNDVGLDRGQLGGERIVRFQRVGPKVLLVQPNTAYRAKSANPDERRAVEESFAQSVLWGFTVAAEEGGRVLVDATDFALRDAHGVTGALTRSRQGAYSLDRSRSALYLPSTRAFPRNSEIEVTLTFGSAGEAAGNFVRSVTPTPEAITVRQRHSFVALPEPGYRMRRSDPRAGLFSISYTDYAAPLGEPVVKRFIARHRLEKKDPSARVSEPVKPIVYYLDRGAPEPVRTALLEGARWWNAAFEAAGYRNAFRVELLPEGADPMDVRYNVIQWVHRATRGWSYGNAVTDPRTGEILKGHVTLGSLRVRHDYLLAEGLLAPYGKEGVVPPEMEKMALARIRQLAAHEVGHTLGLAHNYVASAQGRASVMDYPYPVVRLTAAGTIDLSDAYAEGIGAWDRVAIAYAYQDFPRGTDEAQALDRLLAEARARKITFLSDQDARSPGSAHPEVNMWDNAADAAAELRRVLEVRRTALRRFGENAIRRGMPLATLEEVLVPLYLHHRYQVEAAAKTVAGARYSYALRGDGQEAVRPVPAAEQERALAALLATLDPAELALPPALLTLLPPRPMGYPATRELFNRYTGITFDAVAPAVAAADLTVSLLLHPERAARLVAQHALDPSLPGLEAVIDRLLRTAFEPGNAGGYPGAIARSTQRVVVERLMDLAQDAPMPQVRAVAALKLDQLRRRAEQSRPGAEEAEDAHRFLLAADIRRFQERSHDRERQAAPLAPPGSPIGESDMPDGLLGESLFGNRFTKSP